MNVFFLAFWLRLEAVLDCVMASGGEGFVLQRIQGEGDAFLKVSVPLALYALFQRSTTPSMDLNHETQLGFCFGQAGGALIRRELKEGETLRVTSGALVAFSPTVEYEVAMMKGYVAEAQARPHSVEIADVGPGGHKGTTVLSALPPRT